MSSRYVTSIVTLLFLFLSLFSCRHHVLFILLKRRALNPYPLRISTWPTIGQGQGKEGLTGSSEPLSSQYLYTELEFVTPVTAGGSVKFCQRCKFFHFHSFFVFFLTKTVEIRWNWRCKIFSLKIRRCKVWDKFHVCSCYWVAQFYWVESDTWPYSMGYEL